MSTTEEIVDVCPLEHGEPRIDTVTRQVSCGVCSRMRATLANVSRRNKRLNRHPRETLFRVPVAPFRERYEDLLRDGITASTIARRAGYLCGRDNERGDIQRLKRQLGVIPSVSSRLKDTHGRPAKVHAESVNYDSAVLLCKAMWVEYPSEMGI